MGAVVTGNLHPDTTVTIRDGATYRVLDLSARHADAGLALVECIDGDAPRHVKGRRVMMPAEQLRRAGGWAEARTTVSLI